MGDPCIARSGMGNELNFVPTNKQTLAADGLEDVFVIGDASNLPASKAGSAAHFQSEILFENIMEHIEGRPPRAVFDGHANCFIESGFGKGLLRLQLRNRTITRRIPVTWRWALHTAA
jgi:sulfide:quinone oxidoreductase